MKSKDYFRPKVAVLSGRLHEERKFIQVLVGPRQVGKTTMALQAAKNLPYPHHYASADEPGLKSAAWIPEQWEMARLKAKEYGKAVLILDEVQKLPEWSVLVKQLWDEDSRNNLKLYLVCLGSSQLLLQGGLSESLTGRFELIHVPHWSFTEMKEAFGFNLSQYIYFGGYPGAASLINDEERWSAFIRDSLVETTISRDILLMSRVTKPALLRRLFEIGCHYSGQILSYQKIMGQLQDAGNTTTLAHYLDLLTAGGLLAGIEKYAMQLIRTRSSSPKWQVLDTALLSVHMRESYLLAVSEPSIWGRLVESSIGAYLLNQTQGTTIKIYYWREGNYEVDFVLEDRGKVVCIEVKSGAKKTALPGIEKFLSHYPNARPILVGAQGIPVEEFFAMPIFKLFD